MARLLANPTTGHLGWSPDEAEAYRTAIKAHEIRAMGFGAASIGVGGGDLPLPAVGRSDADAHRRRASRTPIRALADVRTVGAESFKAATSGTAFAEWAAEGTKSVITPPISPASRSRRSALRLS